MERLIIHSKKRTAVIAGVLISSIFFAFLFIKFFSIYWLISSPYSIKVLVDIICGCFLAISIGMLFSADSRYNGYFFGILFGAIIWYYLPFGCIVLEALWAGIIAGILADLIVLSKNRFDWLAAGAKGLLTVAFLVIVAYLLASFSARTSLFMPGTVVDVSEQLAFFYLFGIFVTFLAYWLLLNFIVGVKGSNVFILGPRDSGKTWLLLALYHYMINEKVGVDDGDEIFSDDETDRTNLRLRNLYNSVLRGEKWKRTENYQLALYRLIGKRYKIIPVTWTILDYAGEYYNQLDAAAYKSSIEVLSEKFDISKDDLEEKSGTLEFLKEINAKYKPKIQGTDEIRDLVLNTAYSNLVRSGKVIILIDGEKLLTQAGMADLSEEFGDYADTLKDLEGKTRFKLFGGKRKYCLVVTKTDYLLNKLPDRRNIAGKMSGECILADIPEGSHEAKIIEKRLYENLNRNISFKNLINVMSSDLDLELIAVSVDQTAEPDHLGDGVQKPSRLSPWRVGKLFAFGSK